MRLTREQFEALGPKEKDAYTLSIQSPMTQALMTDDFNSPALWSGKTLMPLKEDGSRDLNVREVTAEQEQEYLLHRRKVGAQREELFPDDQKTPKVELTEPEREFAIRAWMKELKSVAERFKEIAGELPKEYAEKVAEMVRSLNEK